jgi:hypothetical protein
VPVTKKRHFKDWENICILVFSNVVTYIHIHYIIETFSEVGSVSTPSMTSRSLLGMLYIRPLKILLSSILRTQSLLIFSLN